MSQNNIDMSHAIIEADHIFSALPFSVLKFRIRMENLYQRTISGFYFCDVNIFTFHFNSQLLLFSAVTLFQTTEVFARNFFIICSLSVF